MSKDIVHIGTPRHSGRYPWGSGDNPEQRNKSLNGRIDELYVKGMSDVDIAKGLGIKTTQLRARRSLARTDKRKEDQSKAQRLFDKGYSKVEIGRQMGINESSVRSLLNPVIQERADVTRALTKMLKDNVEDKEYIDVGSGVERHIGVSRTKLNTAISALQEEEGYKLHYIEVAQLGTGKMTSIKVLGSPESTYSEVYKNKDKIKLINDYSEDGGKTIEYLEPVRSIDSKRVAIRYGEDGGANKDGVIELRRGVDDISLGDKRYAQVRIGLDDTHYLKGMAIYSDDIPDGVDILFNTNKKTDVPRNKVFKSMEEDIDGNIDPKNPFGSAIKQKHYIDSAGNKQLSSLNIVNEEGDWETWSRNLSSQMLSKQSPVLAKKQLGLAYDFKKEEYNDIMALTNPVVKKKLLDDFAEGCDADAVHLKAAALPRQGNYIILPLPKMKETEIFAPNFRDGEQVVLVRHPHGGKFEIPELVVNNRNKEAIKIMGGAKDAVGINPKVAAQLSGADFDGDTVLVIPNPRVNSRQGVIKTSAPEKGLIDFDPKESYRWHEGVVPITKQTKQLKMGDASNLITDMTIKGAPPEEIVRAVKHSMVVIDSEKHKLDYKASFVNNGIADLKKKYQGRSNGGAATLISRASSDIRVPERKEGILVINPKTGNPKRLYVDPATGKKLYTNTNEEYTNKDGKLIKKKSKYAKMYVKEDAHELSSGTPMESIYADHANKLKALGNSSRKAALQIEYPPASPSAKKAYASEVSAIQAHLNIALKNSPRERQAQLLANSILETKKQAYPDMDKGDIKKAKGLALEEARHRTGAKKKRIDLTDKEWEAIQAGAVTKNVLIQVLNNTDMQKIKVLATPRTKKTLSATKLTKAKSMIAAGYTQAEIADALGISTSSLSKAIK